jgi:hypothetical protein
MSNSKLWLAMLALGFSATISAAKPSDYQDEFSAEIEQMRGASSLAKASPTDAEVGDANSFGRNVKWAGLLQSGAVTLTADCTPVPGDPPPGADDRCVTLNAAPALTSYDFPDIGRMTIPRRTANSLLCHWLTPVVFYNFENNTGVPQPNAQFRLSPYIDVYSDVLNDPALIDPTTGLPFGGKLQTGFAATYIDSKSLQPGDRELQRFSESRTCIAGFLTKRALMEVYGLTENQARDVFRSDITLRFGLRGSAALVDSASVLYGLRVMVD